MSDTLPIKHPQHSNQLVGVAFRWQSGGGFV